MTGRDEVRPDAAALAEDDLLLDRLGRGEALSDDTAAALLSEWRSSLPDGEPPDEVLVAAATATAERAHRPARWGRRAAVLAATTVLLGGGVAAAAEQARPGNPLWPVTEWLYPDLAGSRSAAATAGALVADARAAIEAGRTGDAVRLLEHAGALAGRVTELGERDRLLSDIGALRARATTPSASLPPVPADVATEPVPSGTTQPALPSDVPDRRPSAVPSTVTPSPGEPGQPQDAPTPGLPADTPAPLPSLPLEPTLPGIPAR